MKRPYCYLSKAAKAFLAQRQRELDRSGSVANRYAEQVLKPVVEKLYASGITSIAEVRKELNRLGIKTVAGVRWEHASTVALLERQTKPARPAASVAEGPNRARAPSLLHRSTLDN